MYCSLSRLLSTAENPGQYLEDECEKILEGGEKADWLGSSLGKGIQNPVPE